MQTPNLAQYTVEHLFITVGGNPLPGFVAAQLLCRDGGTVHLLHSAASNESARGIKALIDDRVTVRYIPLEHFERDSDKVYNRVSDAISAIRSTQVGLHYTGGTKTMSVHAYRALEQHTPSCTYSHLNPDRLELVIERSGPQSGERVSLAQPSMRTLLSLSLEDLCSLHCIKLKTPKGKLNFRRAASFPEAARKIGELFAGGDQARANWSDATRNIETTTSLDKLGFPAIVAALRADQQTIQVVDDLRVQPGCSGVKWLKGEWLEDLTLLALQKIAAQVGLNLQSLAASVETARGDGRDAFEVDVIALRGYQLFVFSCATSNGKDKLKLKLFEASVRAAQLGGDEARFALVCGHPNGNEVAAEMKGLLPSRRFAVFGANDLSALDEALLEWFTQLDKG